MQVRGRRQGKMQTEMNLTQSEIDDAVNAPLGKSIADVIPLETLR